MRKFVFITLALFANFIAVDASYPTMRDKVKVFNVSHLGEDDLNKIMLGEHPEIVLEFSENTSLPLRLFLKGDAISLNANEENAVTIAIKQTFYVRRMPNEFLFSNNLIDWKTFSEFSTGKVSLSLNLEDSKPLVELGAEANLR